MEGVRWQEKRHRRRDGWKKGRRRGERELGREGRSDTGRKYSL